MDFQKRLQADLLLKNNTPEEHFLGLTPNEMHRLLYEPLDDCSPLRLRDTIENDVLDRIPLFRLAESFLQIIRREGQLKLTKTGAMPVKVVKELYSLGFLPEYYIEKGYLKLYKEESCISIQNVRVVIELSGLVRKAHGKLSLTKNALKLMDAGNRNQLFKQFFRSFTEKFRWSYNDLYVDIPIGQLGWGFSILLLQRYGAQKYPTDFYAEKYLRAIPGLVDFFKGGYYMTPEQQFANCYGVRTFERFFRWFGFVTLEGIGSLSSRGDDLYVCTGLIDCIFTFNDR